MTIHKIFLQHLVLLLAFVIIGLYFAYESRYSEFTKHIIVQLWGVVIGFQCCLVIHHWKE